MSAFERLQNYQQAVGEDEGVRYLIAVGNDPAFVLDLCGEQTVLRLIALHTLARQDTTDGNRRVLLREVYARGRRGHAPGGAAGPGAHRVQG